MKSALPSRKQEEFILRAATQAGAHDGMTMDGGLSVDGIDWETHVNILNQLNKIASRVFDQNSLFEDK